MELLKAVNEILSVLGEHPVTSTEAKSPTLAVILPKLDLCRKNQLLDGWWYNNFTTTLYPDMAGNLDAPVDCLSFVAHGHQRVVQAGGQFFNPDDRSAKFMSPVTGEMTVDVPFDLLPESAATCVMYSAAVLAYATDIGFEQVVNIWQGQASQALVRMEAEHLRQMKFTTRKSRRYTKLRWALCS